MTDLCVSCNLCCSGAIFARLAITPQEQVQMPDGPTYFESEGGLRMALPCPKLGADGRCGCYEVRPQTCQTYNCKLSKSVNAGDTAFEDAQVIVEDIKRVHSRAVFLAAKAMAEAPDQYEGQRIGQVFRALKKRQSEAPSNVVAHHADEAHLYRSHYDDLVRFYLQSNYRK